MTGDTGKTYTNVLQSVAAKGYTIVAQDAEAVQGRTTTIRQLTKLITSIWTTTQLMLKVVKMVTPSGK